MYAKLFGSVLDSSLWSEDLPVRVLFLTMLAMADREGHIYASRSGLAWRARLDLDHCDEALKVLCSPDGDSSDLLRNPENEGRRVEEVAGGWRLVNYAYYRGLKDEDERREQNRLAQRRFKEKKRGKPRSATVSNGKQRSAEVSLSEAEAEAEADTELKKRGGTRSAPPALPKKKFQKPSVEEVDTFANEKGLDLDPVKFVAYYDSNGWLVGRNRMQNWKAAVFNWARRDA